MVYPVISVCLDVSDSMVEDDLAMFAAVGNEEDGTESFEQLFDKMRRMKGMVHTILVYCML